MHLQSCPLNYQYQKQFSETFELFCILFYQKMIDNFIILLRKFNNLIQIRYKLQNKNFKILGYQKNFQRQKCYQMMEMNLYTEDRPINPNKQYIEQKQQEYRQKKQLHDYLKKHQSCEQVLPCFRNNLTHLQQLKSVNVRKSSKSKAEIYEEIKKKNLEKYGEKKPKIKEPKQKKKKIDPLKMTIQYKPKDSIFIDTNQYQLESHKNYQPEKDQNIKKTQTPNYVVQRVPEKQKYEKLLQILYKQKVSLKEQKQNFEKQKQKLEFKKLVQKQQIVPFLNEIKKQIEQKRKLELSHHATCKSNKDNESLIESKKISMNKPSQQSEFNKSKNKPKDLNKIQSKIEQLQQQKLQIEDEVYRNKREVIQLDDEVLDARYSIEKVNQIPGFDIQSFKDFIDFRTLHPQGNQFYKIAIEVFETGLSVKEAKMKMKIWDMDLIRESEKVEMNTGNYKRKFENGMRITKYSNGWVEVWTPGIQRVMGSKQLGYKVIWLRNGDIKQEWKSKKLISYYSKEKEVVQIQFNTFQPIYYFLLLDQLEQYDSSKKIKTVMFKQGRVDMVEVDRQQFNGYTA